MQTRYEMNINSYKVIPGYPITYWITTNAVNCFKDEQLKEHLNTRIGLVTGDVDRFLRYWNEVNVEKICFSDVLKNDKKWYLYQKGGAFRKWFGNNEYIVNWENDGHEMIHNNLKNGKVKSHNYNGEFAFCEGITWTKITSGEFGARYIDGSYMFDDAGIMAFVKEGNIYYILALLNTKVGKFFLKILNNTMNWLPCHIDRVPYKVSKENVVSDITTKNIELSKIDWDSFETSWDFKKHPLI